MTNNADAIEKGGWDYDGDSGKLTRCGNYGNLHSRGQAGSDRQEGKIFRFFSCPEYLAGIPVASAVEKSL